MNINAVEYLGDGILCAIGALRFTCQRCGQVLEFENPTQFNAAIEGLRNESNTRGGKWFCPDCAATHGTEWTFDTCQDCGELMILEAADGGELPDDWERSGGYPVCPECRESYGCCNRCGFFHDLDRMSQVGIYSARGGETELWCEACTEAYAERCDSCGDYFAADMIYSGSNHVDVCHECYEDGYFTCDECGGIFSSEDSRWDDRRDLNLCEECFGTRSDVIMSYHSSVKTIFYATKAEIESGRTLLHFGLEMECDDPNEPDQCYIDDIAYGVTEKVNPNTHQYMHIENDGSLTSGFEVIWQPMTLGYLWTCGGRERMEMAAKYLVSNDMRADKTDTCGAHIHASARAIAEGSDEMCEVVDKMYYLAHKFCKKMEHFCRRDTNDMFHWAKLDDDNLGNKIDRKKTVLSNMEVVGEEEHSKMNAKQAHECMSHDRYVFFNENTKGHRTLEWRAPKGTLNIRTIMANFEMYWGIIHLAKGKTWKELRNMAWLDVSSEIVKLVTAEKVRVTGDEDVKTDLEGYMNKRGLI